MSVRILIDPYRTHQDADAHSVVGQVEYIEACRLIDKALSDGSTFTVALHNPAMTTWFDHWRGHSEVHFSFCDPVEMLAEAIGISPSEVPAEIREDRAVIVSENLIPEAKSKPLRSNQTVMGWILGETISPIWVEEKIVEPSQIGNLLRECLSDLSIRGLHPTILVLRNRRIESWIDSSPYSDFLRWLFRENPQKRVEGVVLYSLIRNYPQQIRLQVLQFEGRWAELAELENLPEIAKLVPLELSRRIRIPAGCAKVVREYLKARLDEGLLQEVLQFISGFLADEEFAITEYLLESVSELDLSWVEPLEQLEQIFSIAGAPESFLNLLRRLRPRSKPGSLPEDSSWSRVKEWLEEEYFPFYTWCSSVKRIEETIESVAQFETWLLKNYDEITRTTSFAPYAFRELLVSLVQNAPTLFVVVDGLSWEHSLILRKLLSNQGLSYGDVASHITCIPTITSAAKPSLVRGQLPGQLEVQDQGISFYGTLFAEALNLGLEEVDYGSSRDTGLADLVRHRKRAYLYLFNDIDYLIHRPLSSEKRRQQIEATLQNLAAELVLAAQGFSSFHRQELAIVIGSDHGYTELPQTEVPLTRLPSDLDYAVTHSRIIYCADEELPELDGFVPIDRSLLGGANAGFLVPLGYRCAGKRPRGATHGGLTPQETIVQSIVFDPTESIEYLDVEIAIEGEIRRGRTNNPVMIVFANPNNIPVTISKVKIRLVSLGDGDSFDLGPGSTAEIPGSVNGTNLKQNQIEITGSLTAEIRDVQHVTEINFYLNTTGAALIDESFEDDFEV